MSRRVLTTVTMVVLFALLGAGALWGWQSLSAPVDDSQTQAKEPRCAKGVKRGQELASKEVTVSVFNAGDRAGLAGRTLDELTARRFIAGEVGNAPGNLASVRFVRVLAPNRNDPAASLVARQFGRNTFIQPTRRNLGPGVDVVVGDEFVGLVDAPRSITARASGSGC